MIQAAKGLRGGKPNQDGLQLMTTADLLKRTATELKILPASGKPDEKEQTNYLAFTDRMQVRVNQWEAANGKKASPEVLRTLLDEEKMNVVRYDEWGTDKDRPYVSLTPDQQAKAYVVVGDEEIKLSARRLPPAGTRPHSNAPTGRCSRRTASSIPSARR